MEPLESSRKSKKTVTIILVITAILAIASVITGYYFLQIRDIAPKDSNASQGCACYYVQSSSKINTCADATTKDAFEFQTGTVQSNNTCSASCDLRTASPTVNTNPTVLACRVSDFAINPGCIDISIEDAQEKRYANEVPEGSDLTLKATFNTPSNLATQDSSYYSSFSFLVNGQKTEIPIDQATVSGTGAEKTYLITTQLNNINSADALTVQAFGTSQSGGQVTSDACNRVLLVSKPQAPTCTQLNAEIVRDTNDVPKVNEITITTASLSTPKTLSVKFTLGSSNETLTTKDLASKLTSGSLVLSKSYLYNKSNFVDGKAFEVLDKEETTMKISAQVYANGTLISSDNCSGSFEVPASTDTPRTPTDNGNDNGNNTDNGNTDTPSTPTDNTTNYSDFSVTKSASLACIERTSPDNTVKYTITVSNDDTDSEKVVRVEDKLPLGFDYIAGTTIVNGSSVDDADYVTKTLVGSSQQITFAKSSGWNVSSNGVLTIKFTAKAGTDALTGSNLNEVVVVPENTPKDSTSLRTSSSITVAQSCTAPETGVFDTTISKVVLAIFIIFLGTFFYFSQSGLDISERIVGSTLGQLVRKVNLRASNPKQYFEEKIVENLEKKKSKK